MNSHTELKKEEKASTALSTEKKPDTKSIWTEDPSFHTRNF